MCCACCPSVINVTCYVLCLLHKIGHCWSAVPATRVIHKVLQVLRLCTRFPYPVLSLINEPEKTLVMYLLALQVAAP
jgi:hypothetical protein